MRGGAQKRSVWQFRSVTESAKLKTAKVLTGARTLVEKLWRRVETNFGHVAIAHRWDHSWRGGGAFSDLFFTVDGSACHSFFGVGVDKHGNSA